MSTRFRRALLSAIALAAVLVVAGQALAVLRLSTGSTRYVRIVHLRHGQLSVALTAAGQKRFGQLMRGGMALDATCTTLGPAVQGFSERSSSESSEGADGPHRRPTYHTLLDRHADFCDIGRVQLTITQNSFEASSVSGPTLDSIALTQRGAAFLEEDRLTATGLAVLEVAIGEAQHQPDGHFLTAQQFVSGDPLGHLRIVVLVSPSDTPPAGTVGFYSDGVNHAEVVEVSRLGQRIFIDSNDGVLSTNAAEHLSRATNGR